MEVKPIKIDEENNVHIICILDRSGSMSDIVKEVIGAFNAFVEDQKKLGNAKLSLVLFDHEYEVVYDRMDINEVPELTPDVYYARGMTAMYDAIGRSLSTYNDKNAMVIIQTDGYENNSKEYNGQKIKELIKEKENKGWEFIFMGADIDVSVESEKIGLQNKSFAYTKSAQGVEVGFSGMSAATTLYRNSVK